MSQIIHSKLSASFLKKILIFLLIFFASKKIIAATNYVGKFGAPSGNYYTNIQAAVDAASGGDIVIVSNGTYLLSSQIDVNKNLTIQSVNGPENTIVDGNNFVRCFNLYNHNTVVSGFTITNGKAVGFQDGGGVYCSDTTPAITNCTISGNSARRGGGTSYGTANNCTISGNSARNDGGGTYFGTVNNCTISGNSAESWGGGSYAGTVNNCTISGNSAESCGGGTSYSTVNNCTISGNSAERGGGTHYGTVNNSIVYYNSALSNPNRYIGTYNYCCTTPDGTSGTGNISAEPLLLSTSHIATNSPCIGVGTNGYSSGVDVDGEVWKTPPSIGCDEVYANAISGSLSVAISANNIYTYVGTPLTFSAIIEGKFFRNIWTFDDGTAETNKLKVNHSWKAFDKYNVVLTAFNDTHPAGISNSVSIEVLTTNVHYVNINNSTPVPPYVTWATAATKIQDAVDVANNGGNIFVTNGTYLLSSQIDVNKSLTIQSVNGLENTIVDGNNSVRCFKLYNHNTLVSGFTMTNGNAVSQYGGGVYCSDTTPVITNCTISGNTSWCGGTYRGTINNCTISGNTSGGNGGGTFYGIINNCTISGNSAGDNGGGTYVSTINNCTISGNTSGGNGGGTYNDTVNNSIVYYNSAPNYPNRQGGSYNYCCTTPDGTNGTGNISADPLLLSTFHIATNSPCIGAGINGYSYGVDIDGDAWKTPPSIGCDEVYANAISGSLSVAISANNIYTYVGTPLTFSANIEGKLFWNIWTFDDGTVETNKLKVIHTWNTFGEHNVVLTAFNDTYPAGLSNSISIKVVTNVHYVNINNSTPVPPYVTWETAATNIQDAVDVANNGGNIFVTNGTYLLSSQIDVNKSLIIQSVNGLGNTVVDGNNSVRCFYLYNQNTVISGFTITNGNSGTEDGGGVYCYATTPVITNCTISENTANNFGGGTYYGTINNCTISGNFAGNGAGTYYGTVNNCTISGNSAAYGAGTHYGTVNNCTISGNSAYRGAGTYYSTVNDCTISGNSASGHGGGTYYGTINNCTISGNSAGQFGGGTCEGTVNNCIVWGNTAANSESNFYNCTISYSCSSPLPSGVGNISNDPEFVNVAAGDYHLLFTSPCIDAGSNGYVESTTDFDGNSRIINGTVDMGCYEFPSLLQIAKNALIFPSDGAVLESPFPTNVIWDAEKITDDTDDTNLTITKISMYNAENTTEVRTVALNVSNILGKISWNVPDDNADYVLKFEVINSSSLTNSRIFWNNKFTIIPEGGIVFSLLVSVFCLFFVRRKKKSQ